MKTKNIITYSLIAFALTVSSCGKKLDIQPVDNIGTDEALETETDVNNAVVGAYTIMAGGALYGTNLVMVPDLYANPGYLQWTGSFSTFREISRQTLLSTNADVARTWTQAYRAINAANTVIEALDVVGDENLKNEIHGKALFVRGIMYFELTRLFGLPYEANGANSTPAVPIVLKAVKKFPDITTGAKRSTVAEVYTQAENDLLKSLELLENVETNDLYATMGMLVRLYLQQGKYDKARDYANDIIGSENFALASDVEAPFRVKNSSEGVFEIRQNEQSNAGTSNDGLATFYSSYTNNTGGYVGRGDINIVDSYYESFDPKDKRKTELIYEGNGVKSSGWFTQKWSGYFDNIPIVRLSELILTRAECNFRLNTAVGATPLDDINAIRKRAGVDVLSTLTLDLILAERDTELAFEGYRLHDLKRTKRNVGNLSYNSEKLVYPIPYAERSVNPLLEQNPGYLQ